MVGGGNKPPFEGTLKVIQLLDLRSMFILLSLSRNVHQCITLPGKIRVVKSPHLLGGKQKVVPPSSPNLGTFLHLSFHRSERGLLYVLLIP